MAAAAVVERQRTRFRTRLSQTQLNLDMGLAQRHRSDSLNTLDRQALSCPVCVSNVHLPGDDTVEEGKELFENFVRSEIQKEGLEEPQDCFSPEVLGNPTGYTNPAWAHAGKELRLIADEFERTRPKEREKIKDRASKVGFSSLEQKNFFQLLQELFDERITKERILVLFFFCSDLAIKTLRACSVDYFRRLIQWSVSYITEKVCMWVEHHGGWGKVIHGSVKILSKLIVWVGLGVACVLGVKWAIKKLS